MGDQMKQSVVIGLSLTLAACGGYTGYSNQWMGSDPSAGPTHVAGSAENTTNGFDGDYRDLSVVNNSKNNTLAPGGGTGTVKCQSYSGNEFPSFDRNQWARTIRSNGCALCRICDAAGTLEND